MELIYKKSFTYNQILTGRLGDTCRAESWKKKVHSNLKFWKSKRKKVENFDQTFDEKVKQAKRPVHQPSAHKMSKIVCNQIYVETFVWHIETTFTLKTRHPWQYPADVIMEYSNLLQITLNHSASRLCNTNCSRQF